MDVLNGCVVTRSLAESQNVAATLTGTYRDITNIDGLISAIVAVGESAGTPDSFTATFSLMEADDSSGNGSQAVPEQTGNVLSTAQDSGVIHGRATKPYVAVKCVLAFVGGSTPKQDAYGIIIGDKKKL